MTHELYMMLLRKVRKRSHIPVWRPVCRPLILEPCITGGGPEWRDACLQVLKDWQSVPTLLVLMDVLYYNVKFSSPQCGDNFLGVRFDICCGTLCTE